ncbi:MAG: zinc-binding alcohol dehydrogenase [Candidatus Poribacteria bacterium]|nr:zinc-binding alcohol dehydrogenase [Candidatus Poribacteria bacterium]
MPWELIATAPRTPQLREYEEQPLQPNEVRVKSLLSAPKHGTELRAYRADTMDDSAPFDGGMRLHTGQPRPPRFPMRLGNMAVGEVTETGAEARRFKVGDIVFAHLPIRQTHAVNENRLKRLPAGMPYEAALFADPAGVALGAVRESRLRVGDRALVLGLGAIGQMAAQIARLQGARWVWTSDPIPIRRQRALDLGADEALDPLETDVGLAVKRGSNNVGADACLETSGSYAALNDAIRAAGYGAAVVSSAYYIGDASALALEGEWHRNRLNVVSSRDRSEPMRDHPLWNPRRIDETAFHLLASGQLKVDGLLHPIVPMEEAAEAYRQIDEEPRRSVKMGVRHA